MVCEPTLKRSDGRIAITTAQRTLPVVESVHAMHEPFRVAQASEELACVCPVESSSYWQKTIAPSRASLFDRRAHRPRSHVVGVGTRRACCPRGWQPPPTSRRWQAAMSCNAVGSSGGAQLERPALFGTGLDRWTAKRQVETNDALAKAVGLANRRLQEPLSSAFSIIA